VTRPGTTSASVNLAPVTKAPVPCNAGSAFYSRRFDDSRATRQGACWR
jgi:hypothetical protein